MGYRDEAERVAWEAVDPIELFGRYLSSKSLLDDRAIADMERAIASEIAEAFEFALASPNPAEDDLYKNVYAD